MACQVEYRADIERDLRKIDKSEIKRVLTTLERKLQQDPGVGEPLKGELSGLFRLRVGDYRVVYARTKDGALVLRIAHRKDAYR